MTTELSFTGKKTRNIDSTDDQPYATFRAGDWTWYVLKSWQGDEAKLYARWLCKVVTPYTGEMGDIGDTYVTDVVLEAELVAVDGREPTGQELDEVAELRRVLVLQGARA